MATRGGGCCIDKQGQENSVKYANIGSNLSDSQVYQGHPELAGEVYRASCGNALDELEAAISCQAAGGGERFLCNICLLLLSRWSGLTSH